MELGPYKWQRDRQFGNKQPRQGGIMVRGPYDYQRLRHRLGEYPRPAQPGIQPNRKAPVVGWGISNQDYWQKVFQEYLRRR